MRVKTIFYTIGSNRQRRRAELTVNGTSTQENGVKKMKRQVNLIVKLLVMLTLTLQLMPFSVVAETMVQAPVIISKKEASTQLIGEELSTYLKNLTDVERERVKGELRDEQIRSLENLEKTEESQAMVNESNSEPAQPIEQNSLSDSQETSFDTSQKINETTESSDEFQEESLIGAATDFLKAGPLSNTLDLAAESNLILNKTATYNEQQNAVDFQLEAYAKGEIVTSNSEVDVVFVLDISYSMDDYFTNNRTRLDALKSAVTGFADAMAESQKKLGTNQYHTMRLVTYARSATTYQTTYKTNNAQNVTGFKGTVNGLTTASATRQDKGLEAAEAVVTSNKAVPNRKANQVVILFTDGEPADSDSTIEQIAGNAVNVARRIKQNLGATVYSIGIQKDAAPGSTSSADIPNSMLNGISSNYPNATVANPSKYKLTLDLGAVNPKGANYYLTTTTAGGLSSIFQSIATEIGKIDNLTIRDVLTEEPFFASAATSIDLSTVKVYKAWSYAPTLVPDSNALVTYGTNTRTVDVKNVTLDPVIFNGNTPTEASKNNKLIIRFSVKIQDEFLGGNQVMTNEGLSGAYTTSEGVEQLVKTFDIPKVNIPLKDGGIVVKDQKVYLGNSAQVGNFYTNLAKLNGKNNRYVNVIYKIEKGTSILAEKTILAGTIFQDTAIDAIRNETADVSYRVSYSVVPVILETPGVTSINRSATAKIFVFKPVLTVPDRKIYLTNSLNMLEKLPTIANWQHPEAANLTHLSFNGEAPTVTGAVTESRDLMSEEVINANLNQVTLSNNAKFNSLQGFKIYVFRPEVTSSNKQIDLGESTTLAERKVNSTWKNSQATISGIEGIEPVLTFEPRKVGNTVSETPLVSPKISTNYFWIVKANNQDISQYTSQVNPDYGDDPKPVGANFTVYVLASYLTIHKEVVAEAPRGFGDETFLFEITWKKGDQSETYYQTITLNGNQKKGQADLNQLKAGTYTIKEINQWSSRYEADNQQKELQITSRNPGSVTFINTLKNSKWLSDESKVVNKFTPLKNRADTR